ncbi:MAG: hypothetical protein ACI8XX_001707 [Polaribacter sp.]|jgi:hypothetical protein
MFPNGMAKVICLTRPGTAKYCGNSGSQNVMRSIFFFAAIGNSVWQTPSKKSSSVTEISSSSIFPASTLEKSESHQ